MSTSRPGNQCTPELAEILTLGPRPGLRQTLGRDGGFNSPGSSEAPSSLGNPLFPSYPLHTGRQSRDCQLDTVPSFLTEERI